MMQKYQDSSLSPEERASDLLAQPQWCRMPTIIPVW